MTTQLRHSLDPPGRTAPLTLAPGITLARGRVHEICGPARHSFALWIASRCDGPVLWVHAAHAPHPLGPQAIADFADPARFLFAAAPRPEDLLWCTEEALRSGTVPLVVVELPDPPALTPVRRLQLAAEAQGAPKGTGPIGLLLTPGDGGAPGTESRWHMQGLFDITADPQARLWQLDRRRARSDPLRSWRIMRAHPQAPITTQDARRSGS
ncbi:MAG: hypothetical protein OIF47_02260 [Marinibacterium sp.]|nr:hypothetical protein [Marinibacterium sp.]